jgi:hypothetical protein
MANPTVAAAWTAGPLPESARNAHLWRPGPLNSPVSEPLARPTFGAVWRPLHAFGAWRLIRLPAQLATELELAERCGVSLGEVGLDGVRLERAGTPLEQARICGVGIDATEPEQRQAHLRRLGALIEELLSKPLYLDGSVWVPPGYTNDRVRMRRADAPLVNRLTRALRSIANGCSGTYASAADLSRDLFKLAAIANRMVLNRRPPDPVYLYNRLMGGRASREYFEGESDCYKTGEHPTTAALPATFVYNGKSGQHGLPRHGHCRAHSLQMEGGQSERHRRLGARSEGSGRVFFS